MHYQKATLYPVIPSQHVDRRLVPQQSPRDYFPSYPKAKNGGKIQRPDKDDIRKKITVQDTKPKNRLTVCAGTGKYDKSIK